MSSINSVVARMRDMADSSSMPSNVAELLEEAASELEDEDKELSVRVNSAASLLDQISNDPNIKQHTRTEIWNLASQVEGLED
ncbi:MAG: UPF0147 family protein [Candidatus Nanohaloarchaea archaeon]